MTISSETGPSIFPRMTIWHHHSLLADLADLFQIWQVADATGSAAQPSEAIACGIGCEAQRTRVEERETTFEMGI